MTVLSVTHHEHGSRVHVGRLRVHHGFCGFLAFVAGAWAMWTDRRDRWWLHD